MPITRRALFGQVALGSAVTPPSRPFVGLQLGPHSVYDEGIERCLDHVSSAGATAVLVYTHTWYGAHNRPAEVLADDHGVAPRDERTRRLPAVWVKHHARAFGALVPRPPAPDDEYATADVFADLRAPTRARGMQLFGRVLEPATRHVRARIAGWDSVRSVDAFGKPGNLPCRFHPAYRELWAALVDDVFRTYDLDGLQWGSEHVGPLSSALYTGAPGTCFCRHCLREARAQGLDADRARRGFQELDRSLTTGGLTGLLGTLMRHPEVLAWERLQRRGVEALMALIHGTVKRRKPTALVGRHLDHQQTSWDPLFPATASLREVAASCDFVKPILYHDILGPRLRWLHLHRLQRRLLPGVPAQLLLDLHYALRGYDRLAEPDLEDLDRRGLSPEYVFRETRRCVEEVNGRAQVFAGIGFDVPYSPLPAPGHALRTFPGRPEDVQRAVRRALDARASGIVISREYDEMRLPNLLAVGRALAGL